jgi:hypothetical protein
MAMPLAQLIMLKVGRDHLRGLETDGPDYAALEIIDEMADERAKASSSGQAEVVL